MNKLFENYKKVIVPSLKNEFSLNNIHEVPRVEKVVLNMGMGEAIQSPKSLELAIDQLGLIAGQKAVTTKARKSIAGFKLREGMQIGCMVSLRRHKMWDFLERLVNVSLPRIRDFRGVSPKAFDQNGNYTLGVKEQLIFPEIDYDKIDRVRGMNITIVTSASETNQAKALLKALGFPFRE